MTRERIAELRLKQQELKTFADEVDPPLMNFDCDQDSILIKGNEAGLIRFAVELMEVAGGGTYSPSSCKWMNSPLLPLDGIVLDPDPKWQVPKPGFWNSIGAYIFMALFMGFLVVGAIVSFGWVSQQVGHLVTRMHH